MSSNHRKKNASKGLTRAQRREREAHTRTLNPEEERRLLLREETGTIHRQAPLRIGFCYASPYPVAMSSLGYQVIYRMMNSRPYAAAERIVVPSDVAHYRKRRFKPVSIESGTPLSNFDLLAFSVAYDLDILPFFDLLELGGIPLLRQARKDTDPPILLGGPLTASNALPFGPFIDLAVIGDGERAVESLMDVLEDVRDRDDLLSRAAAIPGVWVPSLHGDRIPATQKVTVDFLPAFGQIVTPNAELSNMFLVEASRGCPRYCKFCLVRSPESPMREPDLESVLARIPEHAPRVGFVGAAVSEWSGIKGALRAVIEQGKGVGISSLRADRLDEEFVDLLARGGYRTMTVAADAPSQRLRNRIAKGLRTRHLLEAAQLARQFGMSRLKLYMVIGYPDETEEDLDELVALCTEISALRPLALGVSPLVPKLHTPLGDAPFAGCKEIEASLKKIRNALPKHVDIRATSARWAWVEYRLSQGGLDAGLAAMEAWKNGGGFRQWQKAFLEIDERAALHAANQYGLWLPSGMK